MRAQRRAQQVMGGRNVGDPVAHGFADGVFQSAAAVGYGDDLGAQQAHAEDIETLPAHVFLAHVHRAIEAEQRADGGRGDAVLTRAGLGDNAPLPHAPGEQSLAEAVVDLVRAGVQQVFAFDVDLRAAEVRGETARVIERRGAARVVAQQVVEFGVESGVGLRFRVGALEFFERTTSELRERICRRRDRSARLRRVARRS